MPFYSIPLVILVVVLAILTLLVFTPVVVLVDSRSREVKVRWSFLLSYVSPLPGADTGQQLELSVAGISVPLPRPKRKAPPKRKKTLRPVPIEARKRRRKIGRFMWKCLIDGNIRSALVRRFRRLPIALWDAVEVSRFYCEVSLPDPALNGMLWGALATVDAASPTWLHCNFMGRNEVRTEVRFYPHRLVKAALFFFLQLPYQALLKQWRASN
jgi:hypothetical protein